MRVCSYAGAVAPSPGPRPPVPLSGIAADSIPERRRYRLKNKLLGPPLVTEQLSSERLGRPTALGVLAPDCISSSAYGTEEMLTQMVPYHRVGRLQPWWSRSPWPSSAFSSS